MPEEGTQSETSLSLLIRLQQAPADHAAWAEFVSRYGARINDWCRRWGLQDADVQDVSQAVLFKLVRAMQTFRYDPTRRFRPWLKTVTHNAWQDLARGRRPTAVGGDPPIDDPLQSLKARDDLAENMEAAYEQELLDRAMERVRTRVQPQTWDSFRLTAINGVSGVEAAAQLGLPLTTVYKAKGNVQKLLAAEVRALDECGS